MNISATALLEARQRDGEAADDRPDKVRGALEADREVGYRDGKPLVPHPEGADSGLGIDDDPTEAYSHYVRGDDLLLPEAGGFLRRLFESEHVESVADAADEVNTDESVVRKAAELHGIDVPTEGGSDDDTETVEELVLPSGERIPLALLSDPPHRDKLVLAQLLSVGMSVEEIARYLSKELDERVTPAEVRKAAQEHSLLSGGTDSGTSLIPDRERTVTAGNGDVTSSPW